MKWFLTKISIKNLSILISKSLNITVSICKSLNPTVCWCEFWFWLCYTFALQSPQLLPESGIFTKILSILSVSSEITLKANKTNQNQNSHQLTVGLRLLQIETVILRLLEIKIDRFLLLLPILVQNYRTRRSPQTKRVNIAQQTFVSSFY